MQAKITSHLYLVSHQATANITPTLDDEIRPDNVFLMVNSVMARRAELLSGVLKQVAGVQVQNWMIDDVWDVEHIITRTMELLEQYPDEEFALNATAGTRPMSIGAFQVFQAYQKPVFYVHPEDDRLIWLYPRDQPTHQLADRVRLPQFLHAHGSEIKAQGNPSVLPAYRELAEDLIANINYFDKPVSTLNWYAKQNVNVESTELSSKHLRWDALLDLLDRLEMIEILTVESNCLNFRDNEAKKFASGGWLEQFVYSELLQIRQLLPQIQDVAQSIIVSRELLGEAVQNELDVAFLCNNHFYVIECKTGQLDIQSGQVGTQILYKLDSLKDLLGGFRGQGMVVSYKSMTTLDKRRAADLGIEVCDGNQLQNLRSRLIQWLKITSKI